ncbi:MAG: hypothetical protein QGG14_07735, partial [Planctomycetota bacterium]|nr:hypothetical protein [Planctomycetota bacterium]
NPDACGAYHKNCPHVETCNLTTAQRIGSVIMGNSLVDSLLAQASNQAAAPPPAAPPPPAEGDTVNPSEAHVPVGQGAPVKPTVPGILPAADGTATAPDAPTAGAPTPSNAGMPQVPSVPVTGSGQAADPATPKPKPKRTSKKKGPAAAPDNGLEAVLADLKKIREVDDELADLVAAKIADRIADKLLGEA